MRIPRASPRLHARLPYLLGARPSAALPGAWLSAVTVQTAKSDITLAGHRVGHQERPDVGGGRGTGKQGVPEETPNPGGRNKPIRARAWKGKREGRRKGRGLETTGALGRRALPGRRARMTVRGDRGL